MESGTFALYRIIGNDLWPRHGKGQTIRNLRLILDQEPPLAGCTKYWIVNRIIDRSMRDQVVALLEEHSQPYRIIEFDREEYAAADWDLECFPEPAFFLSEAFAALPAYERRLAELRSRHQKVNYLMNVNGARNVALRSGRSQARWTLPWDGNCFLSEQAWEQVTAGITASPAARYGVVPMARLTDNSRVFDASLRESAVEEPQLMFRHDAHEEFDEAYPYGWRSKVELLRRLGVPGRWDTWRSRPWDLPAPAVAAGPVEFVTTGWVMRLDSGQPHLEQGPQSLRERGQARGAAIIATVDEADLSTVAKALRPDRPLFYPEQLTGTPAAIVRQLRHDARAALARGTFAVTGKSTQAPSGDPHDYWHPAPYWWPDPNSPDGLPFVRRDGHRVPGTELYGPDSGRYDRTRLQRVLDDTTICALAWQATSEERYADHGAALIRRWFLDPSTRMNPSLRYAQVRPGHDSDQGTRAGIIELRDLYHFLDAARILTRSGSLGPADTAALQEWLGRYRHWLVTSDQGRAECRSANNHGVYYDLQLAAVAAYLDDVPLLLQILRRARERIGTHFLPDGSQPMEETRARADHYRSFNLQGWINLAHLAERCGHNLWNYATSDGRGIAPALRRFLSDHANEAARSATDLDPTRLEPLRHAYDLHCTDKPLGAGPEPRAEHCVLSPHYGIRPYWALGAASTL